MKKRMKKSTEWNDIESPSNDLKLIKTKKSIKQLIPLVSGLSFIGISGLLVATSVGLSVPNSAISPNLNGKLLFDDKVFKNKEELLAYAQQNYFQRTDTVENSFNWSIDERGEKVYFNDPKLLRSHLLNNIKRTTALSSKKFNENEGGLGEVSADDFAHLYFDKSVEKSNIYRGRNNSIHETVEGAKESYLSIHDAYYFNNVYFRNIQELKLYLQTVYYVKGGDGYSSLKPQNIGIIGPDGIVSSPINSSDLFFGSEASVSQATKTLQAKKDFMNNIGSQTKKYVQFKNKEGKYFYVSEENLQNPNYYNSDLLLQFDNPSYTTLKSTQGVSSYIVDLSNEDKNTLFGPYYARTPADLSKIEDNRHWIRVEGKNDSVVTSEANSNLISGLLNLLFIEDTDKENLKNMPFNITYLNEDIERFYDLLKTNNNRVYEKWIDFSNTIKEGKRFNTFNSLPIFYIFLIENLIKDNAKESIIIETKALFTKITKYLDKCIAILIPKELLIINEPNSKYSNHLLFEEIFNFNSNDLDLGVNLEYYITEISKNFSQFIVAANVISQASLNAMYNAGVLPYNQEHIKFILNNDKNNYVKEENKRYYERIWKIFSSSDFVTIKSEILGLNQNASRNIDNQFLENLIISLSSANNLFAQSSSFIFEEGLKKNSNISYSSSNAAITNDKYKLLDDIGFNISKKIIDAKENLSWENFNLIKFVNKSNPRQLNNINFAADQSILANELLSIISKMNAKQYSDNFIINWEATKSLFNIAHDVSDTGQALMEGFLNVVGSVNQILSDISQSKIMSSVESMLETFQNVAVFDPSSVTKIMETISGVGKSLGPLSMMAKAIPYAQIALVAIDVAMDMLIPKTKYNSYTFESQNGDGISLTWNGGQSTTMFFGFLEIASTTKEDMKLLPPQLVASGRSQDSYYFNGNEYSITDFAALKKAQLKAIANGEFQSENATIVYTFEKNISDLAPSFAPSDKVFDKLGGLEDLQIITTPNPKYNSLAQHVYNSIHNTLGATQTSYHKAQFVFANGHVSSNPSDTQDGLIKEVMRDIKPVKIAMIPVIINNKPKYNDDIGNDDDKSLGTYLLPSLSWSHRGYFTNKTSNRYIIFDPNQEPDLEDGVITDLEAEKRVKNLFLKAFDIEQKNVIKKEIEENNVFSLMSSLVMENTIFQVKLENNQEKYFFDEMNAFSWLLAKSNFMLYSYSITNDIYKYQDKVFYSRDEFINFVLNNTVEESE